MRYTVISYIPALHKGYIDFFRKYPGALYILGESFVREVPRMERDIRALGPQEVKTMVAALNIFESVEVLDASWLAEIQRGSAPIVMPDEDVNRQFAQAHLSWQPVEFVPVFLRWDKQISTREFEVRPDRMISEEDLDREMIAAAFKEAEKSPDWWRQIGALVVKDGTILAAAYNQPLPSKDYTFGPFGDPRSNFDAGENIELSKALHAEAGAIAQAARQGIALEGASLYVTTFPCPPCAKSVAAAGIKKLYYSKGYSLLDAEDVLRAYGVEIVLVK